jgi:2-phospho-L-lactate guanylyltransferase
MRKDSRPVSRLVDPADPPVTEVHWTVVVPVKGTTSAKSRLGAPTELADAIALDSVEAVLAAENVERVIVVTSEQAAPKFANLGAEVIADAGNGLNAASVQGVTAAGHEAVAVLLGDVPSLTPGELAAALRLAGAHPRAFIADAEGDGTVLITSLDGTQHTPAFGADSRSSHLAEGYVELGFPPGSGLRRDVDTAAQLALIPAAALGPRTRAAVERLT